MHDEVDFEVCVHKAIQEHVDDTLCMLAVLLFAAAAQSLSANNYAIDEPMPAHTPTLLWADEFNEPSLDMTKWSFDAASAATYAASPAPYCSRRDRADRVRSASARSPARRPGLSMRPGIFSATTFARLG